MNVRRENNGIRVTPHILYLRNHLRNPSKYFNLNCPMKSLHSWDTYARIRASFLPHLCQYYYSTATYGGTGVLLCVVLIVNTLIQE